MAAMPIIVGVDGSADSVRALTWAAEYARLTGAPLVGLAAWQQERVYGRVISSGESAATVEGRTRRMLADTVRGALGEDAQVEQRTVCGHPAQMLSEASEDAQLVVVGSRGRGGFTGMLLGSVSRHVAGQASCPVVVLPNEDKRAH